MPTTYISETRRTNRFLGRCDGCVLPIAVEDESMFADIKRVSCPQCGAPVHLERVYGTTIEMSCDTRCEGAIGHTCECSCGGRNHGGAFMQTGKALASAIARYRATTERRQAAARQRAENRRAAREAAVAEQMAQYRMQNAEALVRIESYGGNNGFINSIRDQHVAGRQLSARQIEACLSAIERESEREIRAAQERANAAPAPLGSGIAVTGRIVSAKLVDGFNGPQSDMKMMVAADGGFKVWVSVPMSIYREVRSLPELVGRNVSFVANLERGWGDDISLAKGKRPRQATLLPAESGSTMDPA